MKVVSSEDLNKLGLNRYEAVIIASQHSRRLNSERIQKLERLEEDPMVELEARKISMVALKDLLEGRVKFKRSDSM
jgi:DNA-directed RNA polymerase subunit K/omega